MTANEIKNVENKIRERELSEKTRSNKVNESETRRSNKEREKETKRANKAREHQEKIKTWTNAATSAFGTMAKTVNDPAWYKRQTGLLKGLGTLFFADRMGDDLPYLQKGSWDEAPTSVPGMAILEYVPMYGNSTDNNSPLNMVSKDTYAFIRHENSGHSNYDPVDYTLYQMAVDSAYLQVAEVVRLFRASKLYCSDNKYKTGVLALFECYAGSQGGKLLDAMRKDPTRVVGMINTWLLQLAMFKIPKGQTLMQRHLWLASSVFADSDSPKAQLYAYMSMGGHIYNQTAGAGRVDYTVRTPITTLDQVYDWIQKFIEPIVVSEDLGIMSGDTLRAYGSDGVYVFNPIGLDETLDIACNAVEPLVQFKNTVLPVRVGNPNVVTNSFGYTQENGVLKTAPTYRSSTSNVFGSVDTGKAAAAEIQKAVDLIEANPTLSKDTAGPSTVDEALVYTRNMCTTKTQIACDASAAPDIKMTSYTTFDNFGSEIYIDCKVFSYSDGVLSSQYLVPFTVIATEGSTALSSTADELIELILTSYYIKNFYYLPKCWFTNIMFSSSAQMASLELLYPLWEFENYTIVPEETLKQLNLAAVFSMLMADRGTIV